MQEYKREIAEISMLQKRGKPETVKFLFVGRLVYYKGVDVLLRAFGKLQNAELFIVGSGPLEEELKAEAAR